MLGMIKISRFEAYQGMNETDFKVMDQELYQVIHSDERGNREVSYQFFLDSDQSIVLKMYWDKELVHTVRFNNKG